MNLSKKNLFALLAGGASLYSVNAYDRMHAPVPNGWSALSVNVDGKDQTLYVATNGEHSSGKTLTLPYNTRGYLSKTPSLDPKGFFAPNLLGGSVEYDVNLSTRNCGCIGTIYLVGMPGKDRNGNYWNTDGYYYCDAN
jgi:hypothetical protein